MHLSAIEVAILGAYLLVLTLFGVVVRRIRTFGDFAVGGRAVPGAIVFASLSATYIGPGYTLGFAGKGFASGYLFFFVALAFTAQTLLVGMFLAPRIHRFRDCYTVGDIMNRAYGPSAHLVAGVISFILCIGFVAVMAKVAGVVLNGVMGVPVVVGIALVTGVSVLYSYTGGIKASIATDALQFSILAIILPVLVLVAAVRGVVNFHALDSGAWTRMAATASELGPVQLVGILLSFLLGETLIPPYANRALAAGSERAARGGFLGAAGFSVLWFGMVVGLGAIARGAVPTTTSPDDVFMAVATERLPIAFVGLILVAVISIVMSSQDSVLNASAVVFARDVWGRLAGRSDEAATDLRISRVATLVAGVFAVVVAAYSPSIINGLLIIYSLWAPSVLPPLVLGLLLRRPPRSAGVYSMLAGGLMLWV